MDKLMLVEIDSVNGLRVFHCTLLPEQLAAKNAMIRETEEAVGTVHTAKDTTQVGKFLGTGFGMVTIAGASIYDKDGDVVGSLF